MKMEFSFFNNKNLNTIFFSNFENTLCIHFCDTEIFIVLKIENVTSSLDHKIHADSKCH